MHWQSNGEASDKRLSPWLDPEGEDLENLFGYDPNVTTNFVIVEINPPMSGVVAGDGYYGENENVQLIAEPNEGFKFVNWTNDGGQIVSSQQEFQFLMPQNEILLIANFSDIVNIPDLETEKQNIWVYPNPATSQVTVKINPSGENVTVRLVNIIGQTALKPIIFAPGDHPEKTILLNGLTHGIYFLVVETDEVVSSHKVVITPAN
jgi:hypothetical protein